MAEQARLSPHPAGSWRELLTVAWPLVVSSGSLTLMYVTDRMFLARLSTDALAAGMPASFLHWTLISLFMGTASYVNAFVAQYDGAGRKDRAAAAVWQGVYFAIAASILLLPCGFFAGGIFQWLDHPPEVAVLEAEYFSVMCFGTAPILLSTALAGFYTGRGRSVAVMWANVAGAGANVVLGYCLIFGWGPFPAWGMRGAAVATVLANLLVAAVYVVLIGRDARRAGYPLWEMRRFDRELFGRLLRFGLPSGVHLFVDVACWAVFLHFVSQLGKTELAATNLAFNLNSLVFVPLLGIGTAVMTITGQRIGEERPELAVRTTWRAIALAEGYTLLCAIVYLALPDLILLPYERGNPNADFEAVRAMVVPLLSFVVIYSAFDGLAVIFGSAIRGAGDTRFVLLTTLFCGVFVMVIPTYLVTQKYGLGLDGAWWVATTFVLLMGSTLFARFQTGKWKRMRVIEGTRKADLHENAADAAARHDPQVALGLVDAGGG